MPSNRLLVIDDEPATSATIGRIARGCSFDTIITTDPDDFWKKVKSWQPTVIILDLSMPEINGQELLNWLARDNYPGHILIVSRARQATREAAVYIGTSLGLQMIGSLEKPVKESALNTLLREVYSTAQILSVQDCEDGLRLGEFSLVYQPQMDLRTGCIVGFEALARWNRPHGRSVSPAEFILTMESSDLINPFTAFVMREAVSALKQWHATPQLTVSINVSGATGGAVFDMISQQCSSAEVPLNRVVLELTETAAMTDSADVVGYMQRLHDAGVGLSIDDFGTGNSTLTKLINLPFSEIKIDRSFVSDCLENWKHAALIRSIIGLAHELGRTVVAEGVESKEVLDQLAVWGCDIVQGFYIGRPMQPDAVQGWLTGKAAGTV